MVFLKSKRFARAFCITTLIALAFSLVFNLLGFLGNPIIQGIAASLTIAGIFLLWGQILLSLNMTNRKDRIGWIIVRFAYVTIFVTGLGLLSIAGSTFIASFYLFGGNTPLAALFFSAVGFTMLASFGSCLAAVSYHTLSIEGAWAVDE
jgi:hypothetical protein